MKKLFFPLAALLCAAVTLFPGCFMQQNAEQIAEVTPRGLVIAAKNHLPITVADETGAAGTVTRAESFVGNLRLNATIKGVEYVFDQGINGDMQRGTVTITTANQGIDTDGSPLEPTVLTEEWTNDNNGVSPAFAPRTSGGKKFTFTIGTAVQAKAGN